MIELVVVAVTIAVTVGFIVWLFIDRMAKISNSNLELFINVTQELEKNRIAELDKDRLEREAQRVREEEMLKDQLSLEDQLREADLEFMKTEESELPLDEDMEANQWRE